MLTQSGRVKITGFGTTRADDRPVDTADDLVAVGRILDELLGGETRSGTRPPALESVLAKAMAVDPEPYRTAGDMARDLRAVPAEPLDAEHAPEAAERDASPPATVWPIPGTRYDPAALGKRVIAIAILVAVIALGAFLWRLASRAGDGRVEPTPSPPATTTSAANLDGNFHASQTSHTGTPRRPRYAGLRLRKAAGSRSLARRI